MLKLARLCLFTNFQINDDDDDDDGEEIDQQSSDIQSENFRPDHKTLQTTA